MGSKSFCCSSFPGVATPQAVPRGTAGWWPCLHTVVTGTLCAAGWWGRLNSGAAMGFLGLSSPLCALSLWQGLSFSSCHWSVSRGARPCLELLGSGSSPRGSSPSPQPCTALLLLCPSSVELTTSSVNGWIHTAPPAHEAISWLPDLPLCRGSFASASSWSSPSCSSNAAPPRAPASRKAAEAHCSLHITLTD